MLGHQWLQCGVVVCLVLASQGAWAAYPVVGRSAGTLAVQTAPDAEWRVIPVGGIVPDVGEARTAAIGSAHLQSDHGILSLGTLSQANYDLTAGRVNLLSGRLFCVPSGDEPWTILAGTARVTVSKGASFEVALLADGITVTALKGAAQVIRPGVPPTAVGERQTCAFQNDSPKAQIKPLNDAAELHLIAWTKQLPPSQGVGQLVIKDSQSGAGIRLDIARYHAEVILQPPVALVKLDQSFYNPSSRQEEGEFIFNLPPGASVSRFAMFVSREQLIEGEVIERQRADQIYTSIVRSRRDPAILEQIGDNLFKMRVFPIFPRDIKRILLDFTLPLDGNGGQYQMRLPLLSNLKPIWEFRLQGVIRGPTPLASVQSPTLADVKFDSRGPDEISFDFARTDYRPDSDFVVSFQQPAPVAASKFRRLVAQPLRLTDPPNQAADDRSMFLEASGNIVPGHGPWNTEAGTYFQADLPVPPNVGMNSPADVLVMVDTSSNGSLSQVQAALQTTLASLRDQDRFRLLCVDVVARPMHDGWISPRTPEANAAYQRFEQQVCLGATDMLAVSQAAYEEFAKLGDVRTPPSKGGEPTLPTKGGGLALPPKSGEAMRRRVAIYVGDGLDSTNSVTGIPLAEKCAEQFAKAKAVLFAVNVLPEAAPPSLAQRSMMGGGGGFFQIGPERNLSDGAGDTNLQANAGKRNSADGRLFLNQWARLAGGRCYDFVAQPMDRARYFTWLLSGVPTPARVEHLTVAGCEPIDLYYPDNLLPGEPFRIVGRKLGSVEELNVAWQVDTGRDAPHATGLTLTADHNKSDHLVGRGWADQRLKHLQRILAAPLGSGGIPAANRVIVQLSREWSLLTPQTAYLVLETEQDYLTWNVPRQARRLYWSGKDVPPVERLPADWLAHRAPKAIRDEAHGSRVIPDEELESRLQAARKAIEDGLYERATTLLDDLNGNEVVAATEQYRTLRHLAENLRRQSKVTQSLGIKQSWFDLGQPVPTLPVGLDRLLISSSSITSNFLQRHPLGEVMLQEIDLPLGRMSLTDFAKFLKLKLGTNVVIDQQKLEEESVASDTLRDLPLLKAVSVYSAVRHFLDTMHCDIVEEPRRLRITTKTDVISHRRRVLFPIRDLVGANPKFDFEDLQDPLFDREEAFRARVESKLKKLVTWKLNDASLDDVVARLRKEFEFNLIIDKVKLEEESIATDATDISCDYENVPASELLKWILDTKNLAFAIDHEALKITTKTDVISNRPVRVYPAEGLIFRDRFPDRNRINNPWQRPQFGMGGFGGGGMMGGGFGGGIGGGMGGFGGGFGMSSTGAAGADPAGISDAPEPNDVQQPRADDEADPIPLDGFYEYYGQNADSIMHGIMDQTGGPPDAPWMEADGEGGEIGYFNPSLSFVLRQTEQAHQEVAEHFRQLRAMQARTGVNPNMVPVSPRDAIQRNEMDVYPLMQLLQDTTGGAPDSPWMEYDGEGGNIDYERAVMALSIRQTPQTHDEIAGVLVQLRRNRYALIHQSRPWEQGIFLDRQPGLFSGPWLTALSDDIPERQSATPAEVDLLKVRRELSAGHWKWTDATHESSTGYLLRTAGDKLALDWPSWQIRVQGTQTAVSLTNLQYAELGHWGLPLREWLDVELVFWPHRSNRELANLFEISAAPRNDKDGPQQVRLRFRPVRLGPNPLWIEVVYDKTTGLPVTWEAYRHEVLVQRYRFQSEVVNGQIIRLFVRQESSTGEALAAGEWTTSAADKAIEEPEALPVGTLVIDRRPQTRVALTAFETGLQQMRLGRQAQAARVFQQVLEQHPGHPLVQFLLAWSLDQQDGELPPNQLWLAYSGVLRTAPSELARLLVRQGSRHFSDRELHELMQARPADQRDLLDELALARLALKSNEPREALTHAQAAWKKNPSAGTQLAEVAQAILESHLRLQDVDRAIQLYSTWRKDPRFTVPQLSQLLTTFEYFDRGPLVLRFYDDLLERKAPALTNELRRSILRRYADVTKGLLRWKNLLAAVELLPMESREASVEFGGLLRELITSRAPDAAAELSTLTRNTHYRQALQAEQAHLTTDQAVAQQIYWKLHQEGFSFQHRLAFTCEAFIKAQHPERAVLTMESALRRGARLDQLDRITLAKAYELAQRPLDSKRAMTSE